MIILVLLHAFGSEVTFRFKPDEDRTDCDIRARTNKSSRRWLLQDHFLFTPNDWLLVVLTGSNRATITITRINGLHFEYNFDQIIPLAEADGASFSVRYPSLRRTLNSRVISS